MQALFNWLWRRENRTEVITAVSEERAEQPEADLNLDAHRETEHGNGNGSEREEEREDAAGAGGNANEYEYDNEYNDDGGVDLEQDDYILCGADYKPNEDEVIEYAIGLGVDLENDGDLFLVVQAALAAPLPPPWIRVKPHQGGMFYWDCNAGLATWTHPEEGRHRQMCKRERAKQSGVEQLLRIHVRMAMSGQSMASVQILPSDTVSALRDEIARALDCDRRSCTIKVVIGGQVSPEGLTAVEVGLVNEASVDVVRSNCEQTIYLSDATMRILQGSRPTSVLVGSEPDKNTFAQNPPALGDSWEVHFESEVTAYDITFVGGTNAHHGILEVCIDDVVVGRLDQYSDETTYPMRHTLQWQSKMAGAHVLRGTVITKHPAAVDYWICLSHIVISPVVDRDVVET